MNYKEFCKKHDICSNICKNCPDCKEAYICLNYNRNDEPLYTYRPPNGCPKFLKHELQIEVAIDPDMDNYILAVMADSYDKSIRDLVILNRGASEDIKKMAIKRNKEEDPLRREIKGVLDSMLVWAFLIVPWVILWIMHKKA